MLGTVTWIDALPGGQVGVNWIVGKVAAFNRLPADLTAIESSAVAVKRASEARGRLDLSVQLAGVLTGVVDARGRHESLSGRLAEVMDGIRSSTPGTMPGGLVADTVQTAAGMAALFAAVASLRASVQDAARQVLTAQEQQALALGSGGGHAGGGLAGYGRMAAVLGIGYVALLVATGRGKGRRRRQ